jgi:hypothetical protein
MHHPRIPAVALLLAACLSAPALAVPVAEQVPAAGMKATASSTFSPGQAPERLLDNSGLADGDRHDNEGSAATMWHTAVGAKPSSPAAGLPEYAAWVRLDFAAPQNMDTLLVWNHNQAGMTDRGFRDTVAYGTTDGKQWFPLAAFTCKPAGGQAEEAQSFPLEAGGKALVAVILAAKNNHGGNVYGLSEVQFTRTREVAADALPFPSGLQIAPAPIYRHRPDGKPGREVAVNFAGGRVHGAAKLEVTVDGRAAETLDLPPSPKGRGSWRVLLPDGVGV